MKCWIRLRYFHDFYVSVQKAKGFFLQNVSKKFEPGSLGVNCDVTDDVTNTNEGLIGKICRECFKKEIGPIGIFSGKGIKLDIANLIHMHFLDEVSSHKDLSPTSMAFTVIFFDFAGR